MSENTPPPPSPPSSSPIGAGDPAGFFKALFDFGFTSFITPKVVKVVYIIATVLLSLAFLGFLVSGFAQSAGAGILVLLVGPIVFVLYLAIIRMSLEFAVAIVRMSEDVHQRLPEQ